MKQFNRVVLLSLLGLSLSGTACAEGWYAGLDLTTSKMDLNGDAKQAYDAKMIDNQLNGASIIAGYQLQPWLAIEGGLHAQRMSQQTTFTGAMSGSIDSTIDTTSLSIAAKLSQPLAWGFSAYAKPGLAYTQTDVTATSSAHSNRFIAQAQLDEAKATVHPNLEVGLDYAFNDHFSAGIGYERQFNALSLGDEHYSLDTFKLGLRYHF